MRVLGIDYGEKRIGLALSDETGTFARELRILSPKEFHELVHELIHEHQISKIVLGWPVSLGGQETKKTQEVKKFKEKLEALVNIPVDIMDERMTSQMAGHLPGGNKNVDSLAAQIILQNYLDRNKNK